MNTNTKLTGKYNIGGGIHHAKKMLVDNPSYIL
jgi:hypothetical protein